MKHQFDTEGFLTKIRQCDIRNLDLEQIIAFEKVLPLTHESLKMREAIICHQFANIQEALDSEQTTFGRVERFIAKMMVEEDISLKVEIIKRMLKFFTDFNDYNLMIE